MFNHFGCDSKITISIALPINFLREELYKTKSIMVIFFKIFFYNSEMDFWDDEISNKL